ncbi:MAG TPA: SDR family oxidoreductase [Ktedonobacteraceae bacterium]|nr:SDR family oxidoreductase [Ktedonobacteraceae bacterium]
MALTNFAGSVAVITGGASGIGFATAGALRERGAHVVLADINADGLSRAEEQLRQRNPDAQGGILTVATDVTSEAQVRELMRQALDAFGSIDLVVTCAGVGRGGPIDMFTSSDMQNMMNINFMGTYNCVQSALPAMRQQGSGYFVFLSSVAGKLGTPLLSGYCASKWAVRGFSAALRAELFGTGIGITTVYPAWVDTPMVRQESADAMRLLNVQIMLTPEQVAAEILQAVSEGRRDLTLAPNPDIAFALQLFAADQDKAEDLMGQSLQRQLANQARQSS